MSVKIIICPIKGLKDRSFGEDAPSAAVISSSDTVEAKYLPSFPYVLRIYEDIDREVSGRSFSNEDATAFADFIKKLPRAALHLYFCCDAGESRSPAAAAAAMRYFGLDDRSVWRSPHYCPNMLVYRSLCEALGITVSDGEADALMYENMKAFKNALGGKDENNS